MRTNLNVILAIIGASLSFYCLSSSIAYGQTWYDSEGRALVIQDGKIIRHQAPVDAVEKKESARSNIPAVLELRPELSMTKYKRSGYVYTRYLYSRPLQDCYGSVLRSYQRPRPNYYSRGLYLNYRWRSFSSHGRF